jgi:DNA (cytosine-5)-methyltransferase 1
VASARKGFDPAAILFEREGLRRDSAPSREAGKEVAGTLDGCSNGSGANGPGRDIDSCETLQSCFDIAPTLRSGGANGSASHGQRSGDSRDELIVPCFWNGEQVTQTLDAVLSKGQCMPEKNRFPAVIQDIADSLTANWHNSGGASAGNNPGLINPVFHGLRVRRLMPVECEKLQGFPPGYTLVPVNKPGKKLKMAADGPRYKAIGNSWAVPVVRWIGRRIQAYICNKS